ncbi:MAG TPA: PaaI family thioesterase [Candidatus Dormibacteraeota bacterium]|nr:PaaI family thioesterase [Candidatus Dormibacteraeota bacterium]
MRIDPNPTNSCFGCGGANQRGMQLSFEQDDQRQRIVGRFCLGEEYQGGSGFLHGGIIALLLDEVMSKASRFTGEHAVTADLRVQYKRPIRVNTEIIVEGFVARRDGRQLYHEGEIRNAAGDLLARGEGRFVVIDREKFAAR